MNMHANAHAHKNTCRGNVISINFFLRKLSTARRSNILFTFKNHNFCLFSSWRGALPQPRRIAQAKSSRSEAQRSTKMLGRIHTWY